MSKAKTRPFDPAECLEDQMSIGAYMNEALESEDPAFVADALGVVARACGKTAGDPDQPFLEREAVASIRVGLYDMKHRKTQPARKALKERKSPLS